MSKIELQDFVYMGKLLASYRGMLSEDRQKIMSDYFEFNMTLAEIAQEKNISRQAVLDSIDKSCEKLKSIEKILNLVEKKENLQVQLLEIANLTDNKEITEKVEKILKDL